MDRDYPYFVLGTTISIKCSSQRYGCWLLLKSGVAVDVDVACLLLLSDVVVAVEVAVEVGVGCC